MQYARISLIVAVDDEADSPLSEVLAMVDQNQSIIILEHHQDDMYLLDEDDAREAGGDHTITLSHAPWDTPVQLEPSWQKMLDISPQNEE